ncbi:MAG TPA: hypothetical protein PLU56_12305, partial [Sphingorhabdus lacus]|nr:hypothetical protein [Sphingorhabdus lacus]
MKKADIFEFYRRLADANPSPETELAYRRRDSAGGLLPLTVRYRHTQNLFSVSDVVRRHLSLAGPVASISTAC